MFTAILALLLQPALGHASPFAHHFGTYKVIALRDSINGKESDRSGSTGKIKIYERPADADSSRAIVYYFEGKKGSWSGGGPILPSSWSGAPIQCLEKADYIGCTSAEKTLTTTMVTLSDGRIVLSVFSAGPDFFTKGVWELRRL
ncbi:MAG: hypothetical protein EOP11_10810 [Proteobacteria bacterium]|nr:MAG: hypothetical protein EOP11_10810 [Pseudomonadota bacterium]